jgi:hypothetical protein
MFKVISTPRIFNCTANEYACLILIYYLRRNIQKILVVQKKLKIGEKNGSIHSCSRFRINLQK